MRTIGSPLGAMLAIAALCSCGGSSGGGGASMPMPASATQFSVQAASAAVTAGSALSINVQALDASNHLVSGYTGTVQVTSTDPNAVLPAPLSLSGGQAAFSVTFNTAGNQSVSVSAGSVRGTTSMITVSPKTPVMAILTGALPSGVIGFTFNQTIQASGGVAPYAWKVSSGALPHNLSLQATTTNTVTLSGTPDTPSLGVAFTIAVSDSANHNATQSYTVPILLSSDSLLLSAGTLNFGNQVLGSASGTFAETLRNGAAVPMLLSSIVVDTSNQPSNPGEFKQSGTTCGSTLAPGASCTVNLTFTPGQTGPRAAVLTITDDTAASPQSVVLSGVGLSSGPNATLSTDSLPFGTELVGTTSPPGAVTLTNYGTAALNVSNVAVTSGFGETNNCVGTLGALASCTTNVTFVPGGAVSATGTLSISDDAPGATQTVNLSGTGATNTPPLNGLCVVSCGFPGNGPGAQSDPAQCPSGQMSNHPVSASCSMQSVVVDDARRCSVLVYHRRYSGVCEAN
jgi:hypothetical protein